VVKFGKSLKGSMTLTPLILLLLMTMLYVGTVYAQPLSQASADKSADKSAENSIDRSVLYWAKPGFEPMYIASGVYRNRGFGDLIVVALEKLLPQYRHEVMRANYIRLMSELNHGKNVCAILHKTPAREEFIHYSNTLLYVPSYQLYTSASATDKFQHHPGWREGQIGFNELLVNSNQIRMALTPGHSYGEARDAIIRNYRKNLLITKGYAGQKSLLKMLLAGRIDLILEFPWVVNHHLHEIKIEASQLHKVTLTDVPAYEPAYIACPKTPWGMQLVETLNNIEPPLHVQMGAYIERWLEPAEVEDYRRASREYFGEGWSQEK
jgi:uncharacterized protein (TIGR02285 family)